MITYGQEDDVLQWNTFNPFHDPFQNNGYCGGHIQSDATFYNGCYTGEEVPGPTQLSAEQLGMSNVEHDWLGLSIRNYNHSYDGCEEETEETDEMEPSSSCSSPGEVLHEEEWPLELLDDCSEIDGEVGKRLNQMVPIPHVPRINGEIPSIDEAISDHQRLIDRLRLYDLVELKVEGDGNCQFRALSDQFYRSPEHHKFVRQQVINQLESNRDIYEGYVPMEYDDYLKKLSKTGEWGDHVTLQAAADSYGVKIFVITSFKDTCYIEILPNVQKSKRVIFLSFWAEVHYNSIYPEGDLPVSETKKKKRWWRFGNKH
ncbi:Cysteine proteinases superfamily protein [Rhynchospora pubera]|uniref:ubiquitinyl hydrolase 1 n=1 Tax=Rhynchospora pubera TaxID=906938 RepID=A0AAV8EEX8_9POAL|nr:Cysteine proteinases superfamily protein [Rhynchospora pubera]